MDINTEIWGGENDRSRFNSWTTVDSPYYAKRSSLYTDLGGFVNANVLSYDEFPDNSYVYAGQAGGVTPWGDMQVYYLAWDWAGGGQGTWRNDIIADVQAWRNEAAIGYFYYPKNLIAAPADIFGSSSLIAGSPTGIYNTGFYRWIPDGHAIEDTPENNNAPLRPIVDFNPRFTYGVIMVRYYDKQSDTFQDVTLYNFKTNYSEGERYVIVVAYLKLMHCVSWSSESQNTYEAADGGSFPWAVGCSDTLIKNVNGDYLNFTIGLDNLDSILPLAGMFGTWVTDSTNHAYGVEFESYDPTAENYGYCSKAPVAFSNSIINLRRLKSTTYDDRRTYELYYDIDNNADNIEYLYKAAAAYGLFFTDGKTDLTENGNRWSHEDMYLGLLRSGVGYGDYTRGLDNRTNPIYDYTSSHDSGYIPSADVDPNQYSNNTLWNTISPGASASRRYVLDKGNVNLLLSDLWTISSNIAGVDYDNYNYKIMDSFLVTNPIDSIISLKRFPFDIPHLSVMKQNVQLGKNTGESEGYLTDNIFNTVEFDSVKVYPKFAKSFLDYSPYTEYELYIPFCGTVKLNAGDIIDHYVSVRMQIDLITGSCTAYILVDDLCIETTEGYVACDLSVSGTEAATVDSAIQNGILNHISARENKFAAAMSPLSPMGAASSFGNPWKMRNNLNQSINELDRAEYSLTHIQAPIHNMGTSGGLTSWYQEFTCRLMIYYPEGEAIDSAGGVSSTSPKLADLSAYAHNTGFSCVMNGAVSEFHGKTVGNIDTTSIAGATDEERTIIKNLFSNGVWLP